MNRKIKIYLTLFIALMMQISFAQKRNISGVVSDNLGPVSDISVKVKGSDSGTVTDFDGNYTVKAKTGDIIEFSHVSYTSIEKIVGNENTINVSMTSGNTLDEVVVTALGISRDKKSLGYATQEVKGDELTKVKSGNFANALSGKVSGVQIRKNNNMGGSTNVVIRGNASMTGSNQALFVIDGVPINNTNTNSKGQGQAQGNYYDYGNTASDINPEDIETINVLKGAAASALYGSRAANGVIMITTKKGKNSKGIGVTFNSGITFGSIDKSTFAKYQTKYGAGYGHYYDGPNSHWYVEDVTGDGNADQVALYTEDGSYGAAFDPNLLVYQWDSFDPDLPNYRQATPWVNAKNGPITFFKTPVTYTNSISFEKGFKKGSMRVNYTKFDQSGLMPNSKIDKNNFSLSGQFDLSDKFSVSSFANFIKTDGLGRNSTGYNDNIVGQFKQWWQTNVDLSDQRDAYFSTGRNVTWNPASSNAGSVPIFWDNPYWTRYENYQNDTRNRFIGNVSLNYKFNDWLNVTTRVATDSYSEIQEERRANGSVAASFGVDRGNETSGYGRRNIENTETNYDLMLNFNKNLTDKINLKGILGTNIRRQEFQSIYASTAGGLIVPFLYSLQNSGNALPKTAERAEKIGVDGIYASVSFGYDNFLFLDATARSDHSSTLPIDESHYFYPSIAGSFIFSKFIDTDIITFGKIRANYAEVGNDAPFDFLYDSYTIRADVGTSVGSTKKNLDLRSETTKSTEFGLEMKFLKNRVGFDFAYYKSNSVDQIYGVPVSTATGFSNKILNAGEIENKGIEFSLYGTPYKTESFKWNIGLNYTKNNNEVISLADGIENLQLGSFQGGVTINARVGEPYGVIQGTDYTYENNQRLIDADSGQYIHTSTSDQVIGDTNPDFLMGISNNFKYKNLSLSFLIDMQKGGAMFSLDQWYGQATGLYEETTFINDLGNPVRNPLVFNQYDIDGIGIPSGGYTSASGGFINPGVNPGGIANTTRIRADRFGAFGYRRGLPNAEFVYDASYVKLREVALTYDLPEKFIKNNFLTNISFSVIGSNLWIISKDLPHADPESGLSSGNLQGYSTGSLPSTKDYGFNIKIQF